MQNILNVGISQALLVNNGVGQYEFSEEVVYTYKKFKITELTNIYNTGSCEYKLYNGTGSTSMNLNVNNEYNIENLFNQGYRKVQLQNTNGWCILRYKLYN